MKGLPLMVVPSNLGHANTSQVEKHYGHLTLKLHRRGNPRWCTSQCKGDAWALRACVTLSAFAGN